MNAKFYFEDYSWPGVFEELGLAKVIPYAPHGDEDALSAFADLDHNAVDDLPSLPDEAWVQVFLSQNGLSANEVKVEVVDKEIKYNKGRNLTPGTLGNPLCAFKVVLTMPEPTFIKFIKSQSENCEISIPELIQPRGSHPPTIQLINPSPGILSLFM